MGVFISGFQPMKIENQQFMSLIEINRKIFDDLEVQPEQSDSTVQDCEDPIFADIIEFNYL